LVILLIVTVILAVLCYCLYKQKHYLKIKNDHLETQNDFLQSLRESRNAYDEGKNLNKERVSNSKISFDIDEIGELLVIEDELDYPYKGIIIYVANKTIELSCTGNLREIARIDLTNETLDNQEAVYKIEKLAVNEMFRRKKIATRLLQRVIEWAKLRSVSELYLTAYASIIAISQEDLIEFYSKNGFVRECGNTMRIKIQKCK